MYEYCKKYLEDESHFESIFELIYTLYLHFGERWIELVALRMGGELHHSSSEKNIQGKNQSENLKKVFKISYFIVEGTDRCSERSDYWNNESNCSGSFFYIGNQNAEDKETQNRTSHNSENRKCELQRVIFDCLTKFRYLENKRIENRAYESETNCENSESNSWIFITYHIYILNFYTLTKDSHDQFPGLVVQVWHVENLKLDFLKCFFKIIPYFKKGNNDIFNHYCIPWWKCWWESAENTLLVRASELQVVPYTRRIDCHCKHSSESRNIRHSIEDIVWQQLKLCYSICFCDYVRVHNLPGYINSPHFSSWAQEHNRDTLQRWSNR